MANVRVRLNPAGIRQLMGSDKARREIERRADAIRDVCNSESSWGGYESGPESRNWRASANVWTIGPGAYRDEARSNRMLRNIQAR